MVEGEDFMAGGGARIVGLLPPPLTYPILIYTILTYTNLT